MSSKGNVIKVLDDVDYGGTAGDVVGLACGDVLGIALLHPTYVIPVQPAHRTPAYRQASPDGHGFSEP